MVVTGMTDGAGPRHRVTQLSDGRGGGGVRDASTAVWCLDRAGGRGEAPLAQAESTTGGLMTC